MSISIFPDRQSSTGTDRFAQLTAHWLHAVMQWPSRIRANRELLRIVNGMSDYELSDIGLTRQDVRDSAAVPLTSETGAFFATRAFDRRHRL